MVAAVVTISITVSKNSRNRSCGSASERVSVHKFWLDHGWIYLEVVWDEQRQLRKKFRSSFPWCVFIVFLLCFASSACFARCSAHFMRFAVALDRRILILSLHSKFAALTVEEVGSLVSFLFSNGKSPRYPLNPPVWCYPLQPTPELAGGPEKSMFWKELIFEGVTPHHQTN